MTRGTVPVAAMFNCLALMMIAAFIGETWKSLRSPSEIAGAVFLLMMLGCMAVIASIAAFNRPRFLVPPYLRHRRHL